MGFETKEDKIGRKEFVDKIAYCVDNLQEDQNICIAIDGEWGSGKSFVMEMLYDLFNAHDSYLVVKYDAWKCSFYDEPLFAIFSSILDGAKEKVPLLHGGKQGLKEVGKVIGKDALEGLSKKSGKLGALASFIKYFLKYGDIYKNGATIDTSDEKSQEFKSYQSYLKEVQSSLNEFTAFKDYQGKKNKLIILVDELDRCLPDMQLKILERLHHLFDVKNCAVICALNKESIEKTFSHIYGGDGENYFTKFFDYRFNLEKNYANLLRNSLNSLLNTFNSQLPAGNLLLKEDTDYVGRYLSKLCASQQDFNNREAKRLLDFGEQICRQIDGSKMNYCYLWFIYFMSFEKIYGSNFKVYMHGTYPNIFSIEDVCYTHNRLGVSSGTPVENSYIYFYNDNKVNTLSYMMNHYISRNANLIYNIDDIYSVISNLCKIWDDSFLDIIMHTIDNYS